MGCESACPRTSLERDCPSLSLGITNFNADHDAISRVVPRQKLGVFDFRVFSDALGLPDLQRIPQRWRVLVTRREHKRHHGIRLIHRHTSSTKTEAPGRPTQRQANY